MLPLNDDITNVFLIMNSIKKLQFKKNHEALFLEKKLNCAAIFLLVRIAITQFSGVTEREATVQFQDFLVITSKVQLP